MTDKLDPFRHTPQLREKIKPPEESIFRDFDIESFRPTLEANNIVTDWWYADEEREALRHAALRNRPKGDIWVFAYGSLMWDPAFYFTDIRKCHLPGYSRQFILAERRGARGSPDHPALLAALSKGGSCDGLAFKIADHLVEEETENLWRREVVAPAYIADFVDVTIEGEPAKALTFIADETADVIETNHSHNQTVKWISAAEGILGSNFEYLENIAENFAALGIHDPQIEKLYADVKAYRANNAISQ